MIKDNSKTKLLNQNVNVTEKDINEFHAWIKGKFDTPKLLKDFDSVIEYEDFMYNYDPTEVNSNIGVNEFPLELTTGLEDTRVGSKKKFDIIEPGVYGSKTEEYEFLSEITDKDWEDFLNRMSQEGLLVTFDNYDDEFIVSGSDNYSKDRDTNYRYTMTNFSEESDMMLDEDELGENLYIVVKVAPRLRRYYYFDIISELHPWWFNLERMRVGDEKDFKGVIVTKMSKILSIDDAYKLYKELMKGYR